MKTWGYDFSLMYPKHCKYENYLSLCFKSVKIKQLWTNVFFFSDVTRIIVWYLAIFLDCSGSSYSSGHSFLMLPCYFFSRHPHFLVFVCLMISAGKDWCVLLLRRPVRNRSFGSWKSNELFKDSRGWVCKSTGLESYSKQKRSDLWMWGYTIYLEVRCMGRKRSVSGDPRINVFLSTHWWLKSTRSRAQFIRLSVVALFTSLWDPRACNFLYF